MLQGHFASPQYVIWFLGLSVFLEINCNHSKIRDPKDVCLFLDELSVLFCYSKLFYKNMLEKSTRTITAIAAALILLSTPLLGTMPHQALATSSTGIIVPLYMDPGSYWTQLIQVKNAHPSVPIVAIANPNNGPGSSIDSNYVNGIAQLQSAGIVVVGYVHTLYGSRSTTTLETEMNEWHNWYHVTGIFFDEMANTAGYESYYSNLSSYAASHGMGFTIGNPGTDTIASYMGTESNLCIYEDVGLPSLSTLEGGTPAILNPISA